MERNNAPHTDATKAAPVHPGLAMTGIGLVLIVLGGLFRNLSGSPLTARMRAVAERRASGRKPTP